MGTSWVYFKQYEIKQDEEIDLFIHYIDSGMFNLNSLTSSFLASAIENCGVWLPVYGKMEPPASQVLDDLVDPHPPLRKQ